MSAGSGPGRGAWGWHRLEPEWAERVVATSGVRPGELVLDLGAGTGALAAPLLAAGARVVAVELHPRRADRLRKRFAGTALRVVEGDLLTVPLPGRPFRVVAAPPYGLSTPLLRRLTARGSRLVAADLVLQRAVVNRWAEPARGRWQGERGISVPRRAFSPPPQVDSRVLQLRRR